jgi:hypothetical protein
VLQVTERQKKVVDKALALVGCGYIYGATGWTCTEARIEQQARQYPAYADSIRKYGAKWMGRPCYDCAQLTRAAILAAGTSLPSGATSQWKSGLHTERGTIATLPTGEPGIQLFREGLDAKGKPTGKMNHTAISLGDGTEVEARGHAYGVERRKISDGKWTHWARPAGLDGGGSAAGDGDATPTPAPQPPAPAPAARRTLRVEDPLMRGADIKEAQKLLIRHGCTLPKYGADGAYGQETVEAVLQFQQRIFASKPKEWDGVAGPKTWAALLKE